MAGSPDKGVQNASYKKSYLLRERGLGKSDLEKVDPTECNKKGI